MIPIATAILLSGISRQSQVEADIASAGYALFSVSKSNTVEGTTCLYVREADHSTIELSYHSCAQPYTQFSFDHSFRISPATRAENPTGSFSGTPLGDFCCYRLDSSGIQLHAATGLSYAGVVMNYNRRSPSATADANAEALAEELVRDRLGTLLGEGFTTPSQSASQPETVAMSQVGKPKGWNFVVNLSRGTATATIKGKSVTLFLATNKAIIAGKSEALSGFVVKRGADWNAPSDTERIVESELDKLK